MRHKTCNQTNQNLKFLQPNHLTKNIIKSWILGRPATFFEMQSLLNVHVKMKQTFYLKKIEASSLKIPSSNFALTQMIPFNI